MRSVSTLASSVFCLSIAFAFQVHGQSPLRLPNQAPYQTPYQGQYQTQSQVQNQLQNELPSQGPFYTIDETAAPQASQDLTLGGSPSSQSSTSFSAPGLAIQVKAAAISLLKWALHNTTAPAPTQPYNRLFHFGRWINDPTDETCYNTRSKVLIRDSAAPVSFRPQNHCVVERGAWNEPYTGQRIMDSQAIQIDHMVPLKNAYISGAWQWNYRTRCLYANFMGNKFHLISSSGTENMRKGDRGPDMYLPPATGYRCQYLEDWLKIKLIWKLHMTQSEVAAIHAEIQRDHCDLRSFVVSQSLLKAQRAEIFNHQELCHDR
jgi:hypothetical protein